jgi:hypothetical protein
MGLAKHFKGYCVTLILAVALLAGGAASAQASTFTWSAVAPVDLNNDFTAISCAPGGTLCVATDAQGNVATSTTPADGNSWTVTSLEVLSSPYGNFSGPWSVSCPTNSFCATIDKNGNVFTSTDPTNPTSWQTNTSNTLMYDGSGNQLSGNQMTGISCPSQNLCVATGQGQAFISTDPADGASATWQVVVLSSLFHNHNFVNGNNHTISCPTETLCAAADDQGNVVTSTDPLDGSSSHWASELVGTSGGYSAIACASETLCVLSDNPSGNIYTTTDPTDTSAASWSQKSSVTAAGYGADLSCVANSLCVLSDYSGNVYSSSDPTLGSGATWTTYPGVDASNGDWVQGLGCTSTTFCVAVDGNGFGLLTGSVVTAGGGSCANVNPAPGGSSPTGPAVACTTVNLVVNGGGLSLIANPTATTTPGVTLSAVGDQTSAYSIDLATGDNTGTGNGWNEQLSQTAFVGISGHATGKTLGDSNPLATEATTEPNGSGSTTTLHTNSVDPASGFQEGVTNVAVQQAGGTTNGSTNTDPTNSEVSTPIGLAVGSNGSTQGAETAFQNAALNTGMGNFVVTPTVTIAVPTNTYEGVYQAIAEVDLTSGP